MTKNDELAIKSEERIKAIANGAQMLMGESRQLAAAALYWKEQALIATDAFQQSGIKQVKAEDKIEVLLAERDADKKRIDETDEALCKLLTGVQYMDPPDGGQVEPLEQVARMVEDYRQRIAELEARELDLIVPPRRCFDYAALAVQERDEQWHKALHDACKRGGIKLEVGE